jgi:hypothetical protein
VKLGTAKAAQVRASHSPELTAIHAAATNSAANMSPAESTADVAASESTAAATAHVAASESTPATATHVAASATTAAMLGGHGVRSHGSAKRDGDEEDHDLAYDGLLLDAGRKQNVFHCCHSIRAAGPVEIMRGATWYNRISIAFPSERNSGMGRGELAI